MAEEKEEVVDKKAEEKQRKKEEAKQKKAQHAAESDELEEESGGSKVAVFFVSLLIIVVWFAIIALLIKWDVGGFGSGVLAPILKDVPYVNKILPDDAVEQVSTEDSAYAYDTMADAVERIKELEKELAAFVGKDEALCFSTGFTVNSGVISCLTDRNDYIICDDRDHASIVDGRRLSFSQQLKYKHNDMADLEKQLQKCNPDSVKLIIVDGVFSMEGDLANLPEIVRLKHKYNATIMVDEAHGLGVFGKQGRGVCDHFGLTHEVDLIMGTFSKSLASIGGFIAADSSIINWLRHNARTYIFSASNTPAATASALEALHIIQNEPERLEALWEATNYALKRFREAGFEIGATESPIIPLYVRDTEKTFMVTKLAFDEGVFINPVIPPACAPQDTLVRVALMATHTKDQIDRAVEKLVKAFKALDLL